jgi:hypothetical protein
MRHGHPRELKNIRSAPIRIGDDVWIGAGACIRSGLTVGDGAGHWSNTAQTALSIPSPIVLPTRVVMPTNATISVTTTIVMPVYSTAPAPSSSFATLHSARMNRCTSGSPRRRPDAPVRVARVVDQVGLVAGGAAQRPSQSRIYGGHQPSGPSSRTRRTSKRTTPRGFPPYTVVGSRSPVRPAQIAWSRWAKRFGSLIG